MTHPTRFLPDLLRDALHTLEYRRKNSGAPDDPDYLLLSQGHEQAHRQTQPPPHSQTDGPQTANIGPLRKEVLNYLGKLADDYHLPRKLVYAVADAESSVNANIGRRPNFLMRNGKKVYKNGQPVILSWDYGLMQLNDKSRLGEKAKDPSGRTFKIAEDVKTDWKANARGAVAILSREYDVAEMEQGAGATKEDRAQQTYSAYTHGHSSRDLYLKERHDGLPARGKDRNFLQKYRRWPD